MAIQFDGENKHIVLSTDTSFQLLDIYNLARDWEDEDATIIFHNPFDCSDELLFKLRYGWKFKPQGYSANTTIKVNGKITTTEGADIVKTVPPTSGQPVTWQFDTPATAVLVPVGETVNVWHEPPTVEEISAGVSAGSFPTEQSDKLDKILKYSKATKGTVDTLN